MPSPPKDTLYRQPRAQIADFAFDDAVATVFADMITRSVPGYDALLGLLGGVVAPFIGPGARVYDLGCALGAATAAVAARVGVAGVKYICVDNSPAMLARCRTILPAAFPHHHFEFSAQPAETMQLTAARVVMMNYTLQFIAASHRAQLLADIWRALLPGGVLILSEKIRSEDATETAVMTRLHAQFKRDHGYSDLEVSQKRSALEAVMQLDTAATHAARLRAAGFTSVHQWFQAFNFVSYRAVKS